MSLIARKPSQQLVDLVGTLGGKWSGKSALCRCPAHDDRLPSLSIRQGDHGFLVHCFAGCDNVDVLRELGRIYTSRALSFAGVEYDILKHELTPQQIEIYDTYAEAWAVIHQNLEMALELTGIVDGMTGDTLNSGAKAAARSRFESCKQRFFGQLLLSMKLPTVIAATQVHLARGKSVVMQLVTTAESILDRRLAELSPEERATLDGIEPSPQEYAIDYLERAFPTRQMRVYLTITVIGEHSKAEGYRALRAYAQPIQAGNRFLAIHAREEREAIEQLITLQYRLRRMNVSLSAKKPLFDILTRRGPIRPDLLVAAFDGDTGEEREWALQIMADSRPEYALMKDQERALLEMWANERT